jgi:hypothetical protein
VYAKGHGGQNNICVRFLYNRDHVIDWRTPPLKAIEIKVHHTTKRTIRVALEGLPNDLDERLVPLLGLQGRPLTLEIVRIVPNPRSTKTTQGVCDVNHPSHFALRRTIAVLVFITLNNYCMCDTFPEKVWTFPSTYATIDLTVVGCRG